MSSDAAEDDDNQYNKRKRPYANFIARTTVKQPRMSWLDTLLAEAKFRAHEALCISTSKKRAGTSALAALYREALKRDVKKIKVICANTTALQEFYETELPAHGVEFKFFALLENEDLDDADAELVLVDCIDRLPVERITGLVAALQKSRGALMATAKEYAETSGDDGTVPLHKLTRRLFDLDKKS